MRRAALLLALFVPAALAAGSVVLPHVFSNAAVADAEQVNANFGALAAKANDNDARLTALETTVAKTRLDARLSCPAVKAAAALAKDGVYWLDPTGGSKADAFEAYCDFTSPGGPWTLAARIRAADNQAHFSTGRVGSGAADYFDTNSEKLSDAQINAIRQQSAYAGTTAYKFTCFEDNTGTCGEQVMYCSRNCVFNATASIGTSACSLCAKTHEGALTQLAPNTGTRGMGHHHHSATWFAYQRHPEEGSNAGCKSDACGSGDGHLWVK